MWRLVAAMLTICLIGASCPAIAQDDAQARANRIAYDAARKCAVADILAADDRHDVGDAAKEEAYRAKSRVAFDAAYALGAKLGLTDKQIGRDMDFAQASELPHMLRDKAYFMQAAAMCKALSLM